MRAISFNETVSFIDKKSSSKRQVTGKTSKEVAITKYGLPLMVKPKKKVKKIEIRKKYPSKECIGNFVSKKFKFF